MDREKYLEVYYSNNAKKLRGIVYDMLTKFGGLSQKDYDDFYSIANLVFAQVIENRDPEKDFHNYLCSCLENKIKTEMTRRNRLKRKSDRESISIYMSIGEDLTILDSLKSDFEIMEEISEDYTYSENVDQYLKTLSKNQFRIAKMIMDGYQAKDIMDKLNITEYQYNDYLKDMKSFEKTLVLKQKSHNIKKDNIEEDNKMTYTQTFEKSKTNRLSIASIIKKIDNYTIRFDHPLQRQSDQWCPAMKGNLISDILQGNPIPPLVFAEQIVNGLAIIWDLDGKQRCTNVHSFKNNGYKITKNIRRWNITYQSTLKDEYGNLILDNDGFPISEKREFDIRGKRFSDLPDELKEKFLDYNFEIVQYLNCSSEDIAYHISRYNEGKPMSKSQKGIIMVGEEFASIAKSISAMPFFKDCGNYSTPDTKNGTIERVVVESVMISNFSDHWNKDLQTICDYIKDNATIEMFDEYEDMVDRLTNAGTDEVFEMFNSRDSFIWFGLFSRFIKTGIDDIKFIEFMSEFNKSLRNKCVNGTSYEDLCVDKSTGKAKSSKDKRIVLSKIELLENLMNDYLGLDTTKDVEPDSIEQELSFVRENVSNKIIESDIELYNDVLNDYTVNVDNSSKLLNPQNKLSLIAIVAYSFEIDVDLKDWITDYFGRNDSYIIDQKENYVHMRNDLDYFIKSSAA